MKTVKIDNSDWESLKIESTRLNMTIQSLLKITIKEGLEDAKRKILQSREKSNMRT